MLRKLVIGGIIAAATLVGSAGTGHAGLSVDLGIHLGTPPIFEPVPASPVQYAPAVGVNLFSYGGEFFVFSNGGWYVGAGHNGPWTQLPPRYRCGSTTSVQESGHTGVTRRHPAGRRRGEIGGRNGTPSAAAPLITMSTAACVPRPTATTIETTGAATATTATGTSDGSV